MTDTEATTTQAAAVAQQGADVAPEKALSKKGATRKKVPTNGQKGAPGAKPKVAAKPKKAPNAKKTVKRQESAGPREGSRTAQVVAMLQRKSGATLAEIMDKMGWQKHTTRAFVSATLGKKLGLAVESFKSDRGERTYRIK